MFPAQGRRAAWGAEWQKGTVWGLTRSAGEPEKEAREVSADKPPAARPRGGGRSHPREHSRRPRVSLNNFCWHIQSAGCRVPWEHRLANGFPAWADSTPRAAAAPNLWWNVGSKANFARLIREACHGQVTRGIRTHTVYLPARSLTDTGHLCLPDVPKILPACLGVPRGGEQRPAGPQPSTRGATPPPPDKAGTTTANVRG